MARGENPEDNIIDFLLEIDGTNIGRGRSMSMDRRRSHELKFLKGELHAYYVIAPTGAKRYWNHNHDRDSIPDVRRMEYNSVGGGGEGATDRGGDFVNGDAYVVSHDGKFYSFSGNTVHSEFLSGDPVRAAGIIVSVKGRVQAIDNRSGHYRPGWRNLLQAVEILADQGVFAREAVVALVVSETSTMFFRVADYIRLGQMGFPFGEATSVVRGYQRKYAGAIPVPESVMPYIPAVLKHGWSNDKGNQWDRFFDHFYMQGRNEMPKDVFDLRPHQDWG